MTTTAVRVALRVRPLLKKQQDANNEEQSIISYIKDEPQIIFGNEKRSFTFDFVYPPSSSQEEVYKSSITPLLDRFTEGKNVTILAYGQTGSGKTYSMGTSLESCVNPMDQGIIHRFTDSLFDRMIENCSKSLGRNSYQVYVSFLEVYNEDINDLLNVAQPNSFEPYYQHQSTNSSSSISSNNIHHDIHPTIREDVQGNIYWTGIREERVNTVDDLISLLKKGIQQRTTGSTEMNSSSSRSHAIFSITLKQQINNNDENIIDPVQNDILSPMLNLEDLPTSTATAGTNKHLVSKFHFVDLAGSERLKRTNALGERQKEGIFINGGLLALGNVISALGDESRRTKNQHVPYRDSKLTRLLQDSLGGNSHTLMLACVSPSSSDYTETLNTLKYANRARNIQNRVEVNQYFNEGSPEEVHYLRSQISRLKVQVAMLKDVQTNNEIKMIKEELGAIKSYTQQLSRDLVEAQSERDSLILKLENKSSNNIEVHPLIQQYVQELQTLRFQVAETQSKLNAIHQGHVLDTTSTSSSSSNSAMLLPISRGREHTTTKSNPIKVSSSMNINNSNLFVDETGKKFPNHLSTTSSSRRLNNSTKKRPMIHRMKSTHSSSLSKKRSNNHQQRQQDYHDMDELFKLLRKEYLMEEESSSSDEQQDENLTRDNKMLIDETVLHTSHADTTTTMQNLSFREAEFNNEVFSSDEQQQQQQSLKNFMPDTPISPTNNSILLDDDDDLEALSVPSWSDAPSNQSMNNLAKRKSISLDSMWDDTDSSMTTSRVASTTTTNWGRASNHPSKNGNKSKDMKRQSKNLLKMLHQIQADLLVKRELVGQLEKSEDQYTQMRVNYEERLDELKSHLLEIQNQRDAALKKSGTTIVPKPGVAARPQSVLQLRENRQAQDVRSQYEVKLKRLVAENQELKKKQTQSNQSIQTARAKAEGIIGRLRADIDALKMDKKQLNKGMKMEADKSRETISNFEREMQQYKRREAIAAEARKKLEEANEIQNQVIKKRTEETAAANMQLRQLTNVLRRAANEGTFLNEMALEKILNEANNNSHILQASSPSPKNVTRKSTTNNII